MPETLFAEFPPASTAEWEAAIAKDLKGADYEKALVWRTFEGMGVRPYYRAEDVAAHAWLKAAPGEFPYVRGSHADCDWRIRESVDAAEAAEANRLARVAVAAGAEEIAFGKVDAESETDVALLLTGLEDVPVHLADADARLVDLLLRHGKQSQRKAATATDLDPLNDVETTAKIAAAAMRGLTPFTIGSAPFEEAGANAADDIGFALAAGVDYLAAMEERGVDVARAARLVEFNFAIGRKFFFEIAKLRAFRMLWARVVESFGAPAASGRARIAARTSRWNKTVFDAHVNVLRATTEAMAAVLGGADSVTVAAFDECYRQPDEASRRLARNTQIILKKEAMLARVADPGGGAYALEATTDFLASAAWKRMQEVEARGGYRKTAKWRGEILAEAMAAREKIVAARRRVFVGTNQFANAAEKMLPRIDEARVRARRRGTCAYEELRLRTERSGIAPRVLLAEIGDAKMRAARAQFAANFFACAGFGITARRFNSIDEILTNQADVIVLCSSDLEYAALADELLAKLKAVGSSTPVIVAGNPENAEQLKVAGVADFIHVRSNPLEVLARWQQLFGIRAEAGEE